MVRIQWLHLLPLSLALTHTRAFFSQNIDVHILADGVSSCNQGEVPVALAVSRVILRMRRHCFEYTDAVGWPYVISALNKLELKSQHPNLPCSS